MNANWKIAEEYRGTWPLSRDFDDYGFGCGHAISIGDEVEMTETDGYTHFGVVIGIIRDINQVPVCYKIWNNLAETFDYIPASGGVLCEPCGSSQWSLERIGYTRHEEADGTGYYSNERTGDVIYW